MTLESGKRYIEPTPFHLLARRAAMNGLKIPAHFLFRTEVSQVENSVQRANEFFALGYGCILNITHFSKLDPAQMILWSALASEKMFKRPYIVPMEYYQSLRMSKLVKIAGPLFGITIFPIVIDDTMQYIADKKLPAKYDNGEDIKLGDGVLEYLVACHQGLANGAIVGMAPQMGRRIELEAIPRDVAHPDRNIREPITALVGRRKTPKKVFFLFMSMSLKGNKSVYAPRKGLFRADQSDVDYKKELERYSMQGYDIRLGPAISHGEMLKLAAMQELTLDEFVYNFHSLQVDPRLSKIDRESSIQTFLNYLDMFPDPV